MELSDYLLETLRQDDEFVLYRGRHRRPGEMDPPTMLLLTPRAEHPALVSLRRMEQEYSLRAELDPGWAAQPLALVSHNGRTVLVLADPGGEPLDRLLGSPLELTPFLRLAIGLSAALGRLQGRGLIHKDVKPAHVLVDGASGQAWLTGFGIASPVPREHQSPEPPEFLAGTLPYMAPEQTGRMNRSIDSRSDLYAFGIMLYEMLTGDLPFSASDPMEWVHCHVARQPMSPSKRLPGIPGSVSAIIMKLLAKNAEERYQTAAGAESDLRRCLAEWETQGRVDEFPPGEHDTPDRLLIPEKLYGRTREVETLIASFDRVVAGNRPELVLVSGYSGIGKSSVVNELHKVLVPPRGLFASGKFDQYKRDIPYATLAQAFQSLLRPLLTKKEAELSKWRDALREAVGPNGQLIADLVPELKLIIGEQPPVPEIPPQDAQGRFQLVFRRFISVFARPEHPLALFLDDLQWLDAATLDLMDDLLTRSDIQHLILIGAYRDNEVNPSHPLMRKVEATRQAGAILQDIVLAPLTHEDLAQLIADSLHCEPERATPLAQLIHDKTAGNPFFAIQFFSTLAEEGLLTFDHGEGRWSWDLNRIYAKGYTDNVVDLMVGKLNRLPGETQKALQQLACLGNSAEFAMLRIVYQDSNEEMHGRFWEAVRTGFIFRSEDSYTFLHDRVREAAYSLIPQELRSETHLRIGMLLAARPPEKLEEGIFEIVNQLNRGSHLIASTEEQERVAELNFIAGRRAKTSAAYASALKYLAAGRALLIEESWDHNYELIFNIEFYMAECELLTANKVAAENRLSMLAQRARSAHHTAIVARLRLTLYQTMDRSDRAVEVCLEYLRRGGTDWSPHPTSDDARREYDRIWSQLGNRQIEDLVDLPLMTNPEVLDALDVLTEVVPSAMLCDENLSSQVICRTVNLSLEHGNTDGSCLAYIWFAIIAGPCFGNYRDGFRFGRLGYELVEKRGLTRYQARTYMCFGSFVMPWAKHVLGGRDLVRRAFDAAYRIGDLTFASYCCCELITNFLTVGDPLAEVQPEAEKGLAFVQKASFGLIVDIVIVQVGLIRTLRGLTPKFGCFNDEAFDECGFEEHLANNPALTAAEFVYSALKVQARFLAMDYASAVDASWKAQQLLWPTAAVPRKHQDAYGRAARHIDMGLESAECRFYSALSHAAYWDSAPPDQRQQQFEALAAHQRQLEIWAEHCPETFENRAALVGAEIARIEGRVIDAEGLYERAIRSAHANGFIHNEAVAYEVAARFYAARGFEKIAHAYLREARYCYLRWGADGKVRQLDRLYPHLREEKPGAGPTSMIGAPVEHLDLATVIKVSQAVSGEIVLDKLIDTLMRTAIEHAGAERGLLLLPQGGGFRVEAEASTSAGAVTVRLRESAAASGISEAVVQYAARTQEPVILDDASAGGPFSGDEYIRGQRARSILCLPLVKQGRLVALLYLENNLAAGAFTPARTA
ncbi:MAG TPA: AAA family ATPase, partial [Silvibacterium sp.]|nr:AAA family ATPase [Silvibacterium sp.]